MNLDICLQTLYGANYSTHSENTVYLSPDDWSGIHQRARSPAGAVVVVVIGQPHLRNRSDVTASIPRHVELHDGVSINLNPSIVDHLDNLVACRPYLRQRPLCAGKHLQRLFVQRRRAVHIDNANGGSGNDTIIGNGIANTLNGGNGNDVLTAAAATTS